MHATTSEGPGLRTAVWTQGCSIRCQHCINPQLFSPTGGREVLVRAIIIDAVDAGVEGLTLLGGEPLDQAGPCADLAAEAQAAGLGVICFTGYTFEQALHFADADRLFASVDLVIDGPYQAALVDDDRALVGSSNQRFIYLTDRYCDYDPVQTPERFEVRVSSTGEIDLAGFLTEEQLSKIADGLESRRRRRPTA
ncbi:4Fe-4S single cluster domain-containing protein [Pseudoclavibacter sp. CFCC 13796]|uniref:4Fe-4S single cluster domain-containing protein n=1 Tax=Pseudoclavibacter sp. CFCC 13796 TaxID=2615179 RepID=UPI001CE3E523|nr:4Fe-4S single cluster domain-containing protein [Pseudoclavibacter sp. CFCC 13796]